MAEQMMQKKTGELVANQIIPKGYKQTELGIIPEDWGVFEFSKHFVIYAGGDVPKKSLSDIRTEKFQYPIFANALNDKGLYGYTALKRSKPDSITVTARGYLGHAEYRDEYFFPIVRLLVLEPKGGLSSKYTSFAINGRLNVPVESTGVPQLTAPQLGRMSIVGPVNVGEQNSIAHALSEMDDLIHSVKQLIAKKQAIKTATMQQLLTGRTRLSAFALRPDGTPKGYKSSELGKIPEDWDVAPIGSVLSITTGSRNTQDRVEDGHYPFFVRSQTVERINTYSFDGEAVLTAGDGVGTGKVFHYINGKFDIHQRVYLMYNFGERVSGYFFYLFFSNHFFDRIMSMTAKSSVDSVRREMITDMKMVLPSKAEQTAIATILSDMDSELNALEQKLAKARDVKQGMMQQLLTGRIRLPLEVGV